MAIQNKIITKNAKPKFSVAINSEAYKNLINNTLKDPKRANRFIANIITAVSTNSDLAECDAGSILSAGLLGETLNLSPSPQLGQFYIVPFKDKEKGKVAQFQLGYKGFLQLAMRSGYYTKINVVEVKDGELIKYDRFNEIFEAEQIDDEEEREKAKTIGYYAFFEYTNGFKKGVYWNIKKMELHAKKYSQAYRSDLSKGTNYSFWTKDFEEMAKKTMLRQLISKWGIMSTEMQEAFKFDQAVIKDNGDYEYVDSTNGMEEVVEPSINVDTPKETEKEEENQDTQESFIL